MPRLRTQILCGCAALAALSILGSSVAARGYYNVPMSVPQCFGYGVGPGHHAQLLLGPCLSAGSTAHSVERMARPFHPSQAPPVMIGFGETSSWRPPTPASTILPPPVR